MRRHMHIMALSHAALITSLFTACSAASGDNDGSMAYGGSDGYGGYGGSGAGSAAGAAARGALGGGGSPGTGGVSGNGACFEVPLT